MEISLAEHKRILAKLLNIPQPRNWQDAGAISWHETCIRILEKPFYPPACPPRAAFAGRA